MTAVDHAAALHTAEARRTAAQADVARLRAELAAVLTDRDARYGVSADPCPYPLHEETP